MIDSLGKVDEHKDEIESNEEYKLDDAEILLIGYGSASLAIKEAINVLRDKHGIKAGLFRPITLWASPGRETIRVRTKIW